MSDNVEYIGEADPSVMPSGIRKTVHEGHVTYHDVPLARSGITEKKVDGKPTKFFRSIESLRGAAKFNMRVISPDVAPHPDATDPAAFATMNLADEKYPVLGNTSNQHVILSADGTHGILMGDINIDDNDARGTSTVEIRQDIDDLKLKQVSWGISRLVNYTPGEHNGEAYDAVEHTINPYHLTLAKEKFTPVCPSDKCGLDAKGEADDNDSHGVNPMPENDKTPPEGEEPKKPQKKEEPKGATPEPATGDKALDTAIDASVRAKAAEEKSATLQAELDALNDKVKAGEEEAEAGKKAIETLEAQQKEQITGLRGDLEKALGEEGVKANYGDEGIPEDLDVGQLALHLKLAAHGSPAGEAEAEGGVNNMLKTTPGAKPKGEGDKPESLAEACGGYQEPERVGRPKRKAAE